MSETLANNGFDKWQNFILEELKSLRHEQQRTADAIHQLSMDVIVLKTKTEAAGRLGGAIWGTISAIIVSVIATISTFVFHQN